MRTPPPHVVVWLLMLFAWIGSFVIRIGFSALLPPIIEELGLSYTRAGVLAAAFFYAYMAMQLPAGVLGDRFGRRRMLLVGLLGVAAATFLTGLTGSFLTLVAARLLTGGFQGFLFSNDRAIIVSVTPPDRLGLGLGVSFSGPGIGLMLGLLLGGLLGERMPWRAVVMLFALGPVLAALLIAWRVPAPPRAAATAPVGARLRNVLATRRLWVLGFAGAMAIWVQFVIAIWAPLFFVEVGVASLGWAGTLASLQGLAAVAGMIGGGWADDALRRRGLGHRTVSVAGFLALAVSMVLMGLAIGARSPVGLGLALFPAAFFVWSVWSPVYAMVGEMVSREDLATAFGFSNTVCFLGAVVGPTVVGWTRDLAGSFTAGCYLSALVALLGAALVLAVRPASAPPTA